jgi:hypothetical protein
MWMSTSYVAAAHGPAPLTVADRYCSAIALAVLARRYLLIV